MSDTDNDNISNHDQSTGRNCSVVTPFKNFHDGSDTKPFTPTPGFVVQREKMIFSPRHDLPLVSMKPVASDDEDTAEVAESVRYISPEVTGRRRRRSSAQPSLLSLAGKLVSDRRLSTPTRAPSSTLRAFGSAQNLELIDSQVISRFTLIDDEFVNQLISALAIINNLQYAVDAP